MVRRHILDLSPKNVRVTLQLPPSGEDPHSYTRRVNTDQRLDQVFEDICLPRAQWRRDSKGQPYQLGRHDLKPVARGWLEFIQRSIILTSNHFEVTVERAVMIHYIMLGNEVEVHEVIPQEIYKIAKKSSTITRLAFPHLIYQLCAVVEAHIEGNTPIGIERPITKKGMEHIREPGHGPQ
ncbi:hypothetical protein AHAS_Ahas17G0214400 [Arachis hypogaea]